MKLYVLYSIVLSAVGFIGCSERHPSWFSEFSFAGGWLAGWIRWQCQNSDINHQPLLLLPPLSAMMPFHSPLIFLLLHSPRPTSAVEPINTTLPFNSKSPSVSILLYTPSISLCFSFYPLLFHKLTCSYRDVADAYSAGFVMNGILLDIRRKYTFQCGFTNCLHCPGNDSLNAAENGSQPDSQKDRQHSANRMARLQNLQTAQGKQTERQIGCDRYSHPTTVADNMPIATSGYSHQMREMGNTGNRE